VLSSKDATRGLVAYAQRSVTMRTATLQRANASRVIPRVRCLLCAVARCRVVFDVARCSGVYSVARVESCLVCLQQVGGSSMATSILCGHCSALWCDVDASLPGSARPWGDDAQLVPHY
jgi:hypothetical protein